MESVFSCGFSLPSSQVIKFPWYDEEESDGVKIHEGKCMWGRQREKHRLIRIIPSQTITLKETVQARKKLF